jgi:hypothetical protein
MMIPQNTTMRTIEIYLRGPQGNAFFLLGIAQMLCNEYGMDTNSIIEDMQSGDYKHLLKVFKKHFDSFVTIHE